MIDVLRKRHSQNGCTQIPAFSVEGGEMPEYCQQHAKNDTVNIRKRQLSCEASTKKPGSNVERPQKVAVVTRRCSRQSFIRRPIWGLLTGGAATVCGYHAGDLLGSPAINFTVGCKLADSGILSIWGLGREQPILCADHVPLEDWLVCSVDVGRIRSMAAFSVLSDCALRRSSFHVKAECSC